MKRKGRKDSYRNEGKDVGKCNFITVRRVVGRKTSGEEREGRIKKGRLADVGRGER